MVLRHENRVLRRQLSGRLRWDHVGRRRPGRPSTGTPVKAHAIMACDFRVVETVLLQRLYVLVFIEHDTRRLHVAGVTAPMNGFLA